MAEFLQKYKDNTAPHFKNIINHLQYGHNFSILQPSHRTCQNWANKLVSTTIDEQFKKGLFDYNLGQADFYLTNVSLPLIKEKTDAEELITAVYDELEKYLILVGWIQTVVSPFEHGVQNENYYIAGKSLILFKDRVFQSQQERVLNALKDLIIMQRNKLNVNKVAMKRLFDTFQLFGYGEKVRLVETIEQPKDANGKPEGKPIITFNYGPIDGNGEPDYSFFKKYYVDPFLVQTKERYNAEMQQWLDKLTTSEYVQNARERISMEKELAFQYFKHYKKDYKQLLYRVIVQEQAEKLVKNENSGVHHLLKTRDLHVNLGDLYKFFTDYQSSEYKYFSRLEYKEQQQYCMAKERPKNNLVSFSDALKTFIEKEGNELNKSTELKPLDYVAKTLSLLQDMQTVLSKQCANDPLFQDKMRLGFESFIEAYRNNTYFTVLAMQIDFIMCKTKDVSDEVMEKLRLIRDMVEYIKKKDELVMQSKKYYKARSLSNKSQSIELEKIMCELLKQKYANTFQVVSEMISDIETAKTIMDSSKQEVLATLTQKNLDFDIKVLPMQRWDNLLKKNNKFVVPESIVRIVDRYEGSYQKKNSNRVLNWYYFEGSSEMKQILGTTSKFIKVTNLQLIVILLLQQQENRSQTFKQLKETLALDDKGQNELRVALTALLRPFEQNARWGDGVIVRENMQAPEQPFKPDELVTLNKKLGGKGAIVLYEPTRDLERKLLGSAKEDDLTAEEKAQLTKMREAAIDGQIIKILKQRKVEKIQEINAFVEKSITAFKLPNLIKYVKKRMESLQERGFVQRDPNDMNVFLYYDPSSQKQN